MQCSATIRRAATCSLTDKLRILTAMKEVLRERLTTVFPRQGHYAFDPLELERYPAADLTVERIGDLSAFDGAKLIGMASRPA